jgi:hypothetical protein
VNGQGLGSTVVAADGEIDVKMTVKAAPWVDVTTVTLRLGHVGLPVREPKVLETFQVPSTRDITRFEATVRYSNIPDHSFLILEARGEASMWPVFTPYEVPTLEISDAVGVIGSAFGFGATFGKYKPDMRQKVVPYGFTNPIWVNRKLQQPLTVTKKTLPVSNEQPFKPRVMPDLRKLFHAFHSDPE